MNIWMQCDALCIFMFSPFPQNRLEAKLKQKQHEKSFVEVKRNPWETITLKSRSRMDYVAQAHEHKHSETLIRLPNGFREDKNFLIWF